MYQFTGGHGSGYQQAQNHQQADMSNGAQVHPHQYYGQPAHYSPQHQTPFQAAQHPAQNYSNISFGAQNQSQAFQGYGNTQPHPPYRTASYPGNQHLANQHHGGYGPNPAFQMHQGNTTFGTPSKPFPHGPERRVSQNSPNHVLPQSPESCYNCGAPDHWAQNCPEPRRAIPAGEINRPFKRQKTHGGPPSINTPVAQHSPPNLQRGWSDPAKVQHTLSVQDYRQGSHAGVAVKPAPWTSQQYHNSPTSSTSPDGLSSSSRSQQLAHGPSTPQSATSSRQNSYHFPQNNDQPRGLEQQAQYNAPSLPNSQHIWNMQQQYSNPTAFPMTNASPQTVTNDDPVNGPSTNKTAPWLIQNLPTPAPSSTGSHVPSPPTSDTTSRFEMHKQQSPREMDSTAHVVGSVASTQKKSLDPRTQQAELVAHLFSEAAQTPTTKQEICEKSPGAEDNGEDLEENESDELYGLDFTDIRFEHTSTVSDPAILVDQPILSFTDDFDAETRILGSEPSTTKLSSKYLRNVSDDDFIKNIQETSEWSKLNDDPVFAKIKANTTTVTFQELVDRRQELIQSFQVAEEEDCHSTSEGQAGETDEERLSREQEDRLAALGVTGSAKPVKATPESASPNSPPSTLEAHSVRRVSGDPGWNHYENGRPVDREGTSFRSSPATKRENRSRFKSHAESPSDLAHGAMTSISPSTDQPDQQIHRHRKRVHSEMSEQNDNSPQRRDQEPVVRKQRYKQPVVAAAYGRRW